MRQPALGRFTPEEYLPGAKVGDDDEALASNDDELKLDELELELDELELDELEDGRLELELDDDELGMVLFPLWTML